jgi:hypothetical protein
MASGDPSGDSLMSENPRGPPIGNSAFLRLARSVGICVRGGGRTAKALGCNRSRR